MTCPSPSLSRKRERGRLATGYKVVIYGLLVRTRRALRPTGETVDLMSMIPPAPACPLWAPRSGAGHLWGREPDVATGVCAKAQQVGGGMVMEGVASGFLIVFGKVQRQDEVMTTSPSIS